MSTPNEIRSVITDQIIAALEEGVVPWRRPWRLHPNAGPPTSMASRRPYRGINILLLDMHSMSHGLNSRWWGTYEQIKTLGGFVKRRPDNVPPGQWGCHVVLFKPYSKTVVDKTTGKETQEERRLMRTFIVFNADQCEGEGIEHLQVREEQDAAPSIPDFSRVEQVIAATKADIRHGGERAFYTLPSPDSSWPNHTSGDFITVPQRSRFPNAGAYWETVLHEMAHWSECRVGWDHAKEGYATSELVAELAACFAAAELGVPHGEPLDNHAAYVGDWLHQMRGDAGLIFRASSQASKVTDFILSHERQPQEQPA